MKLKVTAIISIIGAIGWIIVGLIEIFDDSIYFDEEFFFMFTIFIPSIAIVLYVVWTKFGKKDFSELEKIDYENKILQRKIEQKELKQKLEE